MFKRMGIDGKDVRVLQHVFDEMDLDGNKRIDSLEFFQFFGCAQITPLSLKFFEMFDKDGSGDLDFREWVICVWNFCVTNENELLSFCFDMYDTRRRGKMEPHELAKLFLDAAGGSKRMPRRVKVVWERVKAARKPMEKENFKQFARVNRSIFWPLFVLAKEMRRKIQNEHYWISIKKKRDRRLDSGSLTFESVFRVFGDGRSYTKPAVVRKRYKTLNAKFRSFKELSKKVNARRGPPMR